MRTGFDVWVAIGDYDNDGREDIFVGGVHGNRPYHNDGGTFTDVTAKAGLTAPDPQDGPLWSVGGAWVDVNNDGLLDLLVVNYLAWDPKTEPSCEAAPGQLDYCHPKFYKPTPNQLFLNNGDGTFHDISGESGIRAHPGKGMGIGVADYDQDGLMGFFIANDKMNNSLFCNKGGSRFEEITFQAGVALTEDGKFISGMGVDARDIYNDGLPDIVYVRSTVRPSPCSATLANAASRIPLERAAWPASLCQWSVTPPRLPISTTTDWRIYLSPAGTYKRSAQDRRCRSISRTRFSAI